MSEETMKNDSVEAVETETPAPIWNLLLDFFRLSLPDEIKRLAPLSNIEIEPSVFWLKLNVPAKPLPCPLFGSDVIPLSIDLAKIS